MKDILVQYGGLLSLLFTFVGAVTALLAPILYFRKRAEGASGAKHDLLIKLRSFELNMLHNLVKLKFHSDTKHIPIEALRRISNDSEKMSMLLEEAPGAYEEVCGLIALDGKAQPPSKLQYSGVIIIALLISPAIWLVSSAFIGS